jgi:hypothetical protein
LGNADDVCACYQRKSVSPAGPPGRTEHSGVRK